MSRHRDVRNRAYSYEDDYDYEDEDYYEPNSPNNEFMYRRDSPSHNQSVFSFVEQPGAAQTSENAVEDGELLESLLPFVKETVGARFTEAQIIDELRQSNYDADKAVVSLLGRAKAASPRTRLNLPVQIPIPRLDAVALALDTEKTTAKSVTTAIGGAAAAPLASPVREEKPKAEVETSNVATYGSTVQSFSPSELKAFAKAEEKAQQAAVKLHEAETSGAEGKTKISMVVIGHVDAGKSTITGHLLYKLGYVSKKLMHKFEKESREAGKASFAYAWVMDADEEERARGVTMDVGTSFFETSTKHVTLLDAPGHRDFIPKMIAGASQADVAILVVPAVTGEFEAAFENSGQTKEHTLLVRSLGVTQLIVAVNKMDAVGWDKERFDAIVASLTTFLQQSGFRPKNLWFVPVSGITGANLQTPLDPKDCGWYTGPTLVSAIDQFAPPQREIAKPFRMAVSDVSKSMSLGQTITGRVYAGAAAVGDTLMLMPVGQTLTIKGMEQNGSSIPLARAGDTVDLGVTNIDPVVLSTGSLLCSVVSPVRPVRRFEAKIMTMPAVEVPLVKGTCLTIHVHHVDEPVTITRLVSILAKSGEVEKRKPRCITREKSAVVQITCPRPLCLETFTSYRQLGRFTLRDRGVTLAAGIITEILS
ncbi:hypothetical protein Poli38472_004635 [Pythium oligandrum]|uniref:Tr-type G domain-containing protein n=1 Tax=Pythium oligandrum TaxID=41045 RepID=A0A8K1FEL9_PYTOL|nr:hypothetical protein Poli38472_004635 [Pythium oligandrum]|eukprot:TMW59566.1 hypothetical protein Poli38472_004635 [Pythium oligandrum]